MSDYTRIYLQPECCADPDMGRLWCQDDEPETCPDGEKWTPYVLASELDQKQADLDRALARVAELKASVTELIQHYSETWDLPILQRAEVARDGATDAFILRKQAEAVEAFVAKFPRLTKEGRDALGDFMVARETLQRECQRFRQQADRMEADSEGSGKDE